MKCSLALFAVLGLLPMAQAQSPHTPPSPATIAAHEVQRWTTLLTLSSTQVTEATGYFTTEATARQNAWATERAAHQALEAAIKADDTSTIQSTATTLGQIAGEQAAAHATAQAEFYAILNTEQKAKYSELEKEHMGFGHGGPMR